MFCCETNGIGFCVDRSYTVVILHLTPYIETVRFTRKAPIVSRHQDSSFSDNDTSHLSSQACSPASCQFDCLDQVLFSCDAFHQNVPATSFLNTCNEPIQCEKVPLSTFSRRATST